MSSVCLCFVRVQPQAPDAGESVLERFTNDLTQAARRNQLDPLVGRDSELRRITHILLRRTKNNPVLIGESGGCPRGHARGVELGREGGCDGFLAYLSSWGRAFPGGLGGWQAMAADDVLQGMWQCSQQGWGVTAGRLGNGDTWLQSDDQVHAVVAMGRAMGGWSVEAGGGSSYGALSHM